MAFETLDLTGMNIDRVAWRGGVLKTSFGGGYGARARVQPPAGLHLWSLSSGCLPGDDNYGYMIAGQHWLGYYWDFFKRHVTGDQEIFILPFRGKLYHAAFAEDGIEFERFTEDLFSQGGLTIEQRRVKGFTYEIDGSIHVPLDPSTLPLWGWWNPDDHTVDAGFLELEDKSGNDREIGYEEIAVNVVYTPSAQNGKGVLRFNAGEAKTGLITSTLTPDIHHILMAVRFNEANFENYAGVLTADETVAALVGGVGTPTFFNFAFSNYTYRLNGVPRDPVHQIAPMLAWGIVHVIFEDGLEVPNFQIGSDRDFDSRAVRMDLGELMICDELLTPEQVVGAEQYLAQQWAVAMGV